MATSAQDAADQTDSLYSQYFGPTDTGSDSNSPSYNLTASTGRNDSNSVFNNGSLTSSLGTILSGTGSILGALNGQKKPTTKTSTSPSWLPLAIAGGAILLVVMFVFAARK